MSEYNLPNHIPFCGCTKCKIHRLSHQSHASSTLNAGLFNVGTAPVKLADLVNSAGVKLGDNVPKSALTVTLRSVSIIDDVLVATPDNGDHPFRIEPQAGVELAVADLSTHSISATSDGVAVAVSYTRLMSERA